MGSNFITKYWLIIPKISVKLVLKKLGAKTLSILTTYAEFTNKTRGYGANMTSLVLNSYRTALAGGPDIRQSKSHHVFKTIMTTIAQKFGIVRYSVGQRFIC